MIEPESESGEKKGVREKFRKSREWFAEHWSKEAREILRDRAHTKKRSHAALVETLLFVREVAKEFWNNEGPLRASSLAYTTLLSLIPLLIAFSIVIESYFADILPDIKSQLDNMLNIVMPYQAPDIANHLTRFAENAQAASAFGAIIFLLISFRLFIAVEAMFNRIWHISGDRSYQQRFRAFTMLLFWGPVLLGLSLTTSNSLAGTSYMKILIERTPIPNIIPFAILLVAFTMLFWLVPATKVRLSSAFFGAVVTTVLFELVRLGVGVYSESLFAGRLNAIYGTLGLVIIFILAIEAQWVVILVGVEFSYVHQNLHGTIRAAELHLEDRPELNVYFALRATIEIARRFFAREDPPSAYRLAEAFRATDKQMLLILRKLQDAGVVSEVGGQYPGWVPGGDPDQIYVEEIIDSLEGGKRMMPTSPSGSEASKAIEGLFAKLKQCSRDTLRDRSLGRIVRELYDVHPSPDASPAPIE